MLAPAHHPPQRSVSEARFHLSVDNQVATNAHPRAGQGTCATSRAPSAHDVSSTGNSALPHAKQPACRAAQRAYRCGPEKGRVALSVWLPAPVTGNRTTQAGVSGVSRVRSPPRGNWCTAGASPTSAIAGVNCSLGLGGWRTPCVLGTSTCRKQAGDVAP